MPGRVAVTGAQGLLGRHVVAALLAEGAEAILGVGRSPQRHDSYTHDLDWLGRRVAAPLPSYLRYVSGDARYSYARLDLRDAEVVAEVAHRFRPDAVIHTAAALRDQAWAELFDSNVAATMGLVTGLAAAGAPRVVLTSSGSVYGAGGGRPPFAEDGPAEPLDLYGASKRAGEDVARILAAQHGVALVRARVFNLVGPGLQDRHLPAVLAARLAAIARGLAHPVLRLGPLTATRDFVDVRDAARALVILARSSSAAPVYNVASGVETPVQAVLDALLRISGQAGRVRVEQAPARATDVSRAWADVSRLRSLGFATQYDLPETLAEMVAYFDDFPAR